MPQEKMNDAVSLDDLDSYASIDDFDDDEEFEEAFSEATPPEKLLKSILESRESLKYGSDILAVTMDIPSLNRVGPKNFLKALGGVFRDFSVNNLPDEIKDRILQKELDSYEFVSAAMEKHLQPRQVEINTFPEICTLTIRGTEPVDGNDGAIEVFFELHIQPGKCFPDGSIDFTEINRFPQVCKGDCILRIYEPTPGLEGTDAYGHSIAPKPGIAFPLKAGDEFEIENGYDEESKRHYQDYFCKKSGIAVCEFEGPSDPRNIRAISIKNEIVVKDIDFTTGSIKGQADELRFKADVKVEGDVRGPFSIVIDGALNVKGAVEGTSVDVTGPVFAGFVRNFLRSGSDMEIRSGRNATLIADHTVIIRRDLTACQIKAPLVILEPLGNPEVMIGRTVVEADMVRGGPLNVRNIFEMEIGRGLFETLAQLERQYQDMEEESLRAAADLKDRGAVMGQKLKFASTVLSDEQKMFIPVVKQLATMILLGKIAIGKIRDRVKNFEDSCGADFRSIFKHLKLMVDIQENLTQITKQKDLLLAQKEEVEMAINGLQVDIRGRLASGGQVIIRCNGSQKKLTSKKASAKNFHMIMKYDPKSGPYFFNKEKQ